MASNKYFGKSGKELRALVLLATLKPRGEFSHTETLCEVLAENLAEYNVKCEVVRLVELNIKPGLEADMGAGDDWPPILKKLLAADIIIFATPVWWGVQSSVMQRIIERMDQLNDEMLETGKSELAGKVGGMVITGAEDGVQHIVGNLANFMIWNGITLPPACSLSYLGDYSNEVHDSLLMKLRNQKATASMAKSMARNLVFFRRLLIDNPIPQDDSGISQNVAPGAVGLKGDNT